MKTNVRKISLVVICVLVGYLLGSVVGLPISSGVLGAGDISKVSKYQKNLVSPQANAFQEKILTDSTARAKAAASLIFITSRMQEFSDLVDYAARVSDGKTELAEVVEKLQTVKRISDNAAKAGKEAKEAFADVVNQEAKNSAAVYETATKNLSIAYLMLDRQVEVGKEYVLAVDSYLSGKKVEDNKELAMSRELWVNYLYGNAQLNKDSEKVAYYKEKGSLFSDNEFKAVFSGVDASLKKAVMFDAFCGVGEGETFQGVGEGETFQGVGEGETFQGVGEGETFQGVGEGETFQGVGEGETFQGVGEGETFQGVGEGETFQGVGEGETFQGVGEGETFQGVGEGDFFQGVGEEVFESIGEMFECIGEDIFNSDNDKSFDPLGEDFEDENGD